MLLNDRDEYRGLTSGGMDEDTCRTGGLGGGDDSGDIDESTDLEMNRLRGDSLANGGGVCCTLPVNDVLIGSREEK